MKFIAYILALIVLGLSTHPCSDGFHCETLQTNNSHNDSGHENDSCSPFCACCGLTYAESEIKLTLPKVELQLSIVNFYYSFNYSFSYQLTVWHPPVYC